MIQADLINKAGISVLMLLILIFEPKLLYSQADTLLSKTTGAEDNRTTFAQERLSLYAGVFISLNNAGITLGSKQAGLAVSVDVEDALGLNTSSFVYRGIGRLKFGNRFQHAIVFNYFSINRKSTKILDADLELGDYIYPIGTKIESKFNLSIIRAKYEYAFLQDDRVSLGFSAGLYILPLSFFVHADNEKEQYTSFVAPLPVLGLRSDFLITKKLVLKESVEALYLKYNNFVGSILDLNVALEHRTFKHFGFGAGFNMNMLYLSAMGKDYPGLDFFGTIKMDYTGVLIFISYYL